MKIGSEQSTVYRTQKLLSETSGSKLDGVFPLVAEPHQWNFTTGLN